MRWCWLTVNSQLWFIQMRPRGKLPYTLGESSGWRLYVRDRLDHVLACSQTTDIYIIGSNGIQMSTSYPHWGQNRACPQLWHILSLLTRWTRYSHSFFSGNGYKNERSWKIESILSTLISLNPRKRDKQIFFSACLAKWHYCFLTLKKLPLMKSCFGMRDTDYSPFLGQHIISVQVPDQWPTSKHTHTHANRHTHTLQGKLSFTSLMQRKMGKSNLASIFVLIWIFIRK